MGLMDRAFMDRGFVVIPGCEIDPEMREMHQEVCGSSHLTHDLADLPAKVEGMHFDGIIGGPPCQAHTKLRAIRKPKYPDLTPKVNALLGAVSFDWFLFENVAPTEIPGAESIRLNAMHFYQPHQSRARWFTYQGIEPPEPIYSGNVGQFSIAVDTC
jgi:hypothetical protein